MIHALVAGPLLAQMVSFWHLLLLHMAIASFAFCSLAWRLLHHWLFAFALFLASFEAGTRWELAVVLHLLHTRVRSVQSLVACCSLASLGM